MSPRYGRHIHLMREADSLRAGHCFGVVVLSLSHGMLLAQQGRRGDRGLEDVRGDGMRCSVQPGNKGQRSQRPLGRQD